MKTLRKMPFLLAIVFSAKVFAAEQAINDSQQEEMQQPSSAVTTVQQPPASKIEIQQIPSIPSEETHAKWQTVIPEQHRQATQQKIPQKQGNLTTAQKQRIKESMRKEWRALTPEEKQSLREQVQLFNEIIQESDNN